MPCYDGRENLAAQQAIQDLDKLTRLLCEATKELADEGLMDGMSDELVHWWKEHKKLDEKRSRK